MAVRAKLRCFRKKPGGSQKAAAVGAIPATDETQTKTRTRLNSKIRLTATETDPREDHEFHVPSTGASHCDLVRRETSNADTGVHAAGKVAAVVAHTLTYGGQESDGNSSTEFVYLHAKPPVHKLFHPKLDGVDAGKIQNDAAHALNAIGWNLHKFLTDFSGAKSKHYATTMTF